MELSEKEKTRLRERYGSWAVVTGASSGIGEELARLLASAGLNLVVNGRDITRLEAVAQRLAAQYRVNVMPIAANLSTAEGVQQLLDATQNLDVGLLVNNAGYATSGVFADNQLANERDMVRLNCEAVLVLTHFFTNQFRRQRRGGIIFLSSLVAFQGVPYAANYAATKAYVQSLSEGLAKELAPYGIDVLAAAPGPVASGFGARANMRMGKALTPEEVGVPILRALGRTTLVLPGWLSKLLIYGLRTAPRWAKVQIMGAIMGGFTKHQRA